MKNLIKSMISKRDKEEQKSEVSTFKEVASIQKQRNDNYKVYVALRINSEGENDEIAFLGANLEYKDRKPTIIIRNAQQEVIFEEIRPDAVTLETNDIDELEEQLEYVKEAIESIKENYKKKDSKKDDVSNTYEGLYLSDWEAKKKQLERKILHEQLGANNFKFHRQGVPYYAFDLEGYYKLPVANYYTAGIIAAPPVHKIDQAKLAVQILHNAIKKRQDPLSMLKWGAGLVIMLILILGVLYLFSKAGAANTESMQVLADITENLKNMTENQKLLFDTYVPELNSSDVLNESIEVIR